MQTEWLGWLERAFGHSQTHNALLFLLLNGIKDQRFINDSIVYGLDLLSVAFSSKQVSDASLQMVDECLVKEPRVVNEAVELCKWFVTNEKVIDLTSEIMQRVHLREDLIDVMTWQLGCGCYEAACSDEFRQVVYDEGLAAAKTERFNEGAYNSFVRAPLANTVTFGLYSYFSAEHPQSLIKSMPERQL